MFRSLFNPAGESVRLDSRNRSLDAVRGFAVALVVFYHTAYRFPPAVDDFCGRILRAVGWIGVDIFFALSGFLIVAILTKSNSRNNIRLYFWKRFLRIVPIFMISVAVFLIAALFFKNNENLNLIPFTFLFLNGWIIPFLGPDSVPFTITWSLSIEVFAYIVLGIAAKFSVKNLYKTVWSFLLVAFVVRVFVYYFQPFEISGLYFFVPARLDSIAFGGIGAMGFYSPFIKSKYAPFFWGIVTIGAIISVRWLIVHPKFIYTVGFALFGLISAIWISSLFYHNNQRTNILVKLLAPVGKYSYFIYLFHLFFLQALMILNDKLVFYKLNFWQAAVVALATTMIASAISWRYLEAPLIRRGKKLPKIFQARTSS